MKALCFVTLLCSTAVFAQQTPEQIADAGVVTGTTLLYVDHACGRDSSAEALPTGPVAAPYHEADVATGRRACPRTEVGAGGHGGIIIDTPGFYGGIEAAATVFGSYALNNDTEVFGTLEAYRYHYVVEATIDTAVSSLGQLTVGGTRIVHRWGDRVLAPTVRLQLPTSFASNVRVIGGEIGLAYNERLFEKLQLHGYAGLDGSMGFLTPAAAYPRGGALVNFGAQLNVTSWFGLALDVNGHFLRRAALDYLAPALGLRFRFGRVGAELGLSRPLAGADRHLVTGLLRVGYRF